MMCNAAAPQYIVKPPGAPLSAFPWHRDSDWVADADIERHPYISVRCRFDDAGDNVMM